MTGIRIEKHKVQENKNRSFYAVWVHLEENGKFLAATHIFESAVADLVVGALEAYNNKEAFLQAADEVGIDNL